jgi:tripartite ATP-independent transporter DctM subunit
MTAALVGLAGLFVLLFAGVPIAWGMALVGTVGFASLAGWGPALSMVGQLSYETSLNYGLSVLPLFILMGNLITQSKLSDGLYSASNAFVGHYRGGQAMATILACGGFAAVSGSSIATAATMSKVAMPSMRRYGYSNRLAAGAIAAGGTLGILIPPSVIMVIYGIMTRTDIGKLFVAGIVPGLIGVLCYIGAVAWTTWRDPSAGPRAPRVPWKERWPALAGVRGVLVLFAVVIGGIYTGWFTPTEAAGIGAAGALLFALARRALTWSTLGSVLIETAKTTAMMFAVLIGALLFSNFVNIAGLPQAMTQFVLGQGLPPLGVIALILAIYLVLGCVLESLSMVLLTVPVFFPIVQQLGFDPVWFGILVVMVIEISLITPPIGMNVFVLRTVLPDIPTADVFRGVTPFIVADVFRLALVTLVPWIVLFLPNMMK